MKYLIANWKSHKTSSEAQTWFAEFETLLSTRRFLHDVTVVIAVPFPFLALASQWLQAWNETYSAGDAPADDATPVHVELAVQDVSQFPAGSYTGAVSVRNLADFDVRFAIVGHSERRRYFHETSQEVASKVAEALDAQITPIVCVDDPYLEEQAKAIQKSHRDAVIVAYEALKTIGTGNNLSAQEFTDATQEVSQLFGSAPIMYGGSVESSNVQEYEGIANGFLVGSASLKPADFVAILDRMAQNHS